MKTLTTLAIATLVLASVAAQAQTSIVKIFLTENSNDPAQAHNPVVIGLSPGGNNNLAYPDAGNAATIGNYNHEMFPFTRSADDFEIVTYDARQELTTHITVPFGILSKDTGNVKVYAALTSSGGAVVPGYAWIENINTGEHFNLLDTVKLDVAENTDFLAEYVIHIGLPVSNAVTNETCYQANDGSLHVQGHNTPGFTHELTLNGVLLYNTVVSGTDTLVNGLAAGNYVSVVRILGVPVDSSDITIAGAPTLIADFYADFNIIQENDTVNFFDNTTNAYNYSWNFGDGDSTTTPGNVMHRYTTAGNYMVTLTIVDENGCTASNFDFIQVDPGTASSNGNHGGGSIGDVGANNPNLGSAIESFRNTTRFTVNNGRLMVNISEETFPTVTIVSANGTVIANEKQNDSVSSYELPATGMYIVTIVYSDGQSQSTAIFAQ
jgi:PKD repeat protein